MAPSAFGPAAEPHNAGLSDAGEYPQEVLGALIELWPELQAELAAAIVSQVFSQGDQQWQQAVTKDIVRQVGIKLDYAWQMGWQPRDLQRYVSRQAEKKLRKKATALIMKYVANSLLQFAQDTVPAACAQQVSDSLGANWRGTADHIAADLRSNMFETLGVSMELVYLLCRIPELASLTAPPGEPQKLVDTNGIDDRVLEKVRNMLAKAESTEFAAEAETFTAAAQRLMTKFSIDAAMLHSTRNADDAPEFDRIPVDAPYEDAKLMLLHGIAEANRCRVVINQVIGSATVAGYRVDITATQTLFASLLVQATHAMTQEGTRQAHGKSRTRSFRKSFLSSFAIRIAERLAEEANAEQANHADSAKLLPVLASRLADVEDAFAEAFPNVAGKEFSMGNDPEGWALGHHAADLANLSAASGAVNA